ncbi:MAG TPA: NADH-quinone oxidoreductase subunit C [Nitrospirae bacterium]|nr:NADH-quinone oxidoreductase subunit C [Nitrospirota bacterium]
MEPLEIAERLKEHFPTEVIAVTEFRGQVSLTIKKERIVEICRWLHDEPDLYFDYLKDLCGVDYLGRKPVRFEVVYTLYSMKHGHMIRLKAEVSEDDPAIDSVIGIWRGADWHERECYDMFGIEFRGHPDLRRILLPEDWEGHPLRKDYPEKGPAEEWKGFQEVLDRAERLKVYTWKE